MSYGVKITPMVNPQDNEIGCDVVVLSTLLPVPVTALLEVQALWFPGGVVFEELVRKGWLSEAGFVLRGFRFTASDSITDEGFRTELRWSADCADPADKVVKATEEGK